MIPTAMSTIPITDLRTRQPEVIEAIQQMPVMLTRQGRGAGVLVAPEMWNEMVMELERFRRQRRERHQQIRADMDAGHYFTMDQVDEMLRKDGILP